MAINIKLRMIKAKKTLWVQIVMIILSLQYLSCPNQSLYKSPNVIISQLTFKKKANSVKMTYIDCDVINVNADFMMGGAVNE